MKTSTATRGRWAAWHKAPGGAWEKVGEGTQQQALAALFDLTAPGEMLLLPAGQQPAAGQHGQFRRGMATEG
jgi:hypothetical protein